MIERERRVQFIFYFFGPKLDLFNFLKKKKRERGRGECC